MSAIPIKGKEAMNLEDSKVVHGKILRKERKGKTNTIILCSKNIKIIFKKNQAYEEHGTFTNMNLLNKAYRKALDKTTFILH